LHYVTASWLGFLHLSEVTPRSKQYLQEHPGMQRAGVKQGSTRRQFSTNLAGQASVAKVPVSEAISLAIWLDIVGTQTDLARTGHSACHTTHSSDADFNVKCRVSLFPQILVNVSCRVPLFPEILDPSLPI
jgi:hypothetical protein